MAPQPLVSFRPMNVVDLIVQKRDGGTLASEELHDLIAAYTREEIPDYQMSAFLMAALLRGMTDEEAVALTDAMLYSGDVLDLTALPGVKVDKHSTGGVGDKVSLILAPTVAACGVPVPMISGRGLAFSGGTLDKLESIPGFRTDLSVDDYKAVLARCGAVMIGQTAEIAPADRKLYALRDVTGTVEFIPFIAASIMSKKLAEGIDALVLDVKCGRGAFMQTEADARRLAETLVGIGERFGKPTVALMTDMNEPLGRAIGTWPEVVESIRCLQGADVPDLMEVTLALAGEMLCLGGVAETPVEGRAQAAAAIADGRAFAAFIDLVEAQGGDTRVVQDPASRPDAEPVAAVRAPDGMEGFITALDARSLGYAAVDLGAGRRRKEDPVDPTAGLVLRKKVGDAVQPGDVLADLYTRRTDALSRLCDAVCRAVAVGEAKPSSTTRLLGRYTADGWSNPSVDAHV